MVELLQYLIGGLVAGSIYGLIGIAYTAVYNVTRIVNFAQGADYFTSLNTLAEGMQIESDIRPP